MLKLRLITAALLIPTIVGSVVWLPDKYFAIFFGLFAVVGSWEWAQFMRLQQAWLRLLYATLAIALLFLCWQYVINSADLMVAVLLTGLLWWIGALVLILLYPRHERFRKNRLLVGLIGLLVLIPCWLSIVFLRNSYDHGVSLVLYLVVLIAVADSGAYFGGRKWGANKLAPLISPGKSWEGVMSGLICVAVFGLLCAWSMGLQSHGWQNLTVYIGISLITAMFSVLGDLTESMFKRYVGIKDSGSIFPGHGGVLDRIDSITAAAPVFVICMWIFFADQNGLLKAQ